MVYTNVIDEFFGHYHQKKMKIQLLMLIVVCEK